MDKETLDKIKDYVKYNTKEMSYVGSYLEWEVLEVDDFLEFLDKLINNK